MKNKLSLVKSLAAFCAERSPPLLGELLAIGIPCTVAKAQQGRPAAITNRIAMFNGPADPQLKTPECPRSTARIVGQLTAGVIGAWIGGALPYTMIDDISAPDRRVQGDAGYQRRANVAFALGSWVGSTVGVAVSGRVGCRSLRKAAIGTAIPSSLLLLGYDEPYLPVLGVVLGAPLQAIGGTIALGVRK